MKYLELDQETEANILSLMDAALRAEGIKVLSLIDNIRTRIKVKECCVKNTDKKDG